MLLSLLPLNSFSLLLHFSTNTLEILSELSFLSGSWPDLLSLFIRTSPPSYPLSLGVILSFSAGSIISINSQEISLKMRLFFPLLASDSSVVNSSVNQKSFFE